MAYFLREKYQIAALVFTILLCVSGLHEVLAMRPLDGDHWMENDSLHVQSLRGKVPPTEGNPCTHIPGRGSGRCTLEMDVAGGGHATQEAFPGHVVSFAAATASVAPMTLKSKDQLVLDHHGFPR
ncbi:hypothetical protein D8674_007405 [Pyrus ussuriensis x Pyrus communis]|uniref:Uncharacterized protein n=1 Tax=Pyrus ussuriensis x Pyrus communis TaxID=2448454 RepID=A0A5N5HPP9_9ROSA|nr:hypothetical protein D8674_007405 [Pyrus ussuriensis x Pyrus communis]